MNSSILSIEEEQDHPYLIHLQLQTLIESYDDGLNIYALTNHFKSYFEHEKTNIRLTEIYQITDIFPSDKYTYL